MIPPYSLNGRAAVLFPYRLVVFPTPPPQDKTGAVVYYEQLGKIDDEVMRRLGLDAKQMLWHYMYQASVPSPAG